MIDNGQCNISYDPCQRVKIQFQRLINVSELLPLNDLKYIYIIRIHYHAYLYKL